MISAVVVDDERKNRDTLCKLLGEYCNDVRVIGQAGSVNEGIEVIHSSRPQVVFLDIEMPDGTGFDLLRKLGKTDFKVIFVTAHSDYAIKAIRFSAIDYLLKPVDSGDLIEAVKRAGEERTSDYGEQYKSLLGNVDGGMQRLVIPIRDGFAFLIPGDIVRLQADGTYTHIFANGEKYTATKNIGEYESILSDKMFFRSHNSHLINLNHVKRFSRVDGYFVEMSDGSVAEISRRKKDDFIKIMGNH